MNNLELFRKYKRIHIVHTISFGSVCGMIGYVFSRVPTTPLSLTPTILLTLLASVAGAGLGFWLARMSARECQDYEEETERIMKWLNGETKERPKL